MKQVRALPFPVWTRGRASSSKERRTGLSNEFQPGINQIVPPIPFGAVSCPTYAGLGWLTADPETDLW
jgi:hypothetical protein